MSYKARKHMSHKARKQFWITALVILAVAVAAGLLRAVPAAADSQMIKVRPGESISAAIAAAVPGTLINVQQGTYVETVQVIGKSDLVIQASNRARIDCGRVLLNGFNVVKSRNIEIKNFDITNCVPDEHEAGVTGYGILATDSQNVTAKNNAIFGNTFCGIGYYRVKGGEIKSGNRIFGNGAAAVMLSDGTSGVKVAQNTLDRNGRGVFIANGANHNLVVENTVTNHRSQGIALAHGGEPIPSVPPALALPVGPGNSVRQNTAFGNNPDLYGTSLGDFRENRFGTSAP